MQNAPLLGVGAGFWAIRAVVQLALFRIRRSISLALTTLFALGALLHGVSITN